MRKISTLISTAILLLVIGVLPVLADGTETEICTTSQYGETTCTKTTENEIVVHEPVDAALGDNPLLIATLFAMAGFAALKISKTTSKA